MNRTRILRFFVLPALAGLVATLAVYLNFSPPAVEKKSAELVEVVVATAAVPAKTMLSGEMVEVVRMPREFVPQGALPSLDTAVGKVTMVPLSQGEVVINTKLALENVKSGLSYHIPPGRRAITAVISPATAAGGLVEPGDRIDVVATISPENAEARGVYLLEDLLVLAIDRVTEASGQSGGDKDGQTYSTMTLAASPRQAVLLSLAQDRGKLRFALRPAVADDTAGFFEITERALYR